jgi:hypothetical protein
MKINLQPNENFHSLRFCLLTAGAFLLKGLLIALTLPVAMASPSLPMRLSTDSSGGQANNKSAMPAISANGRYVVFISDATNLVEGDTNYRTDVFVKDIETGAVDRVSTDSNGVQANNTSISPSISASGRYVTFTSWADSLVPDDTNTDPDIFVKDTQTGVLLRVNTDSSGAEAEPTGSHHYGSGYATISADGRYVAFHSFAQNLAPGNYAACSIFVKDIQTGETRLVSTDSAGVQDPGLSQAPSISAEGRYVTFTARALLFPGGAGAFYDVFVKDTHTGITSIISTGPNGERANGSSGESRISPNGQYVVFGSSATNLTSGGGGLFLKDVQTSEIFKINRDYATGGQVNGSTSDPSVSDNARVPFWTFASNMDPADTNQCFGETPTCSDIYVWNKESSETTRVSMSTSGAQGNGNSGGVDNIYADEGYSITPDGNLVVFESGASNLVPGDTNGQNDIFLVYSDVKNSYWSWYDGVGARNWILMANTGGSDRNLGFGVEVAGQHMDVSPFTLPSPECAGGQCAAGETPVGSAITPIFPGVIGGPVKARVGGEGAGALASQRVLWGDSLEEVVATPETEFSDHYFWPWYDSLSPGFTNWVLVSNPNYAPVYYRIKIAGQEVSSGELAFGESATPTFPGLMSGPVEVEAWSDAIGGSSPARVIASQRVLSDNGKALNEVPGIPAAELSDHYLWTWYDEESPGTMDWILISNPNQTPVDYTVRVAGQELASGTLNGAGPEGFDQVQLRFPGSMGGPVEVSATGTVIASQRTLWGDSFEEVPGFAHSALASSYHWTWYDSSTPGAVNWVLVANPNPTPVTYTIKIAGEEMATGTLEAAGNPNGLDMATPVFDGVMGGPVEVTSTGGPVIASQRVLWQGHFNEVVGTVLP